MEGIEILHTIEVIDYNEVYIGVLILFAIIFVAFIFAMIAYSGFDASSFVLSCILLCLVICFGILYKNSETIYTEYMVTIDETVNVVDFFERYEVIEHEDKLWRIKEKEND